MIITIDYNKVINLQETRRHQKAFLNVAVSFLDSLDDEKNTFHKDAEEAYKSEIQSVMDVAFVFLDALYTLGAKEKALECFHTIRFGKNGYFYILDKNLDVVEHPFLITGQKDFKQLRDALGSAMGEKIEQAASQGSGFFTYMWTVPGKTSPVEKLAYVRKFAPWDWYVCTGIFLDELEQVAEGRVKKAEELFGMSFSKVPLLGDAHMLLFNGKKEIIFQDPFLKEISQQKDQFTNRPILELLMEASKTKNQFVQYQVEQQGKQVNYESYVHYFPPLDSYVATAGPSFSKTLVSKELLWRQVLFLSVATIFFVVIVLLVVRKITRPLQELTKKVDNFSLTEEQHKKVKRAVHKDQIQELSLKFDEMKLRIEEDVQKVIDLTRAQSELIVARETQQKMLPIQVDAQAVKAVDLAGILLPAVEVAGDFFDHFLYDGRWLYFAIGDVSDKGMSSAWTMTMIMTMLRIFCRRPEATPQDILAKMNQEYAEKSSSFDFITMWLGQIDLRTGRLTYASAGHPPPLFIRKGEPVQFFTIKPARPLGISLDTIYRNETLFLIKSDVILLYTDGVTDATNPQGEFFGRKRLQEELEHTQTLTLLEINQRLLQQLEEFSQGTSYPDDITLLTMRYMGITYPIICELELAKQSSEIKRAQTTFKMNAFPLDHVEIMEVELVIEELLQNIIDYSGENEQKIALRIEITSELLLLKLVYAGQSFDPRQYLSAPHQKPPEEGGKGLLIVSKIFSVVDYFFSEGKNHLTLQKKTNHEHS